MKRFQIGIAGYVIEVEAAYASTSVYCEDYLTEGNPDFRITLAKEDIENQRKITGGGSDAQVEIVALHQKLADLLPSRNVFMFHGSAVSVDGEVYIFTAPSGTGKSTHARYWKECFGERCVVVNDDKPFLKVEDGRVLCCGSPWSGKHRVNTNTILPVKAIILLARDNYDHIEKADPMDLFDQLYLETYRPPRIEDRKKVFALLAEAVRITDVYTLGCTMRPEAAMIAYRGMNE